MLRVSRGTLYVVNFYSMQAFSGAIVAIDSIAVLVALFPVSWIENWGSGYSHAHTSKIELDPLREGQAKQIRRSRVEFRMRYSPRQDPTVL